MKNSSEECGCELDRNNEIFSDAIDISWDLLRKNKFCFDTSDERVSRTSAYLGVEIFEAIKKIREKFMNDSMCVDEQKKLVTLEKQQKTAVIKTSGSELNIIESNDDNISNDFAYSIDEDQDEEVFKESEIDNEELKNDNFDSEIINHVENHNNDNKKINNNYNNNKNYSNMCTSSPINLSDKITSTTDGIRINVIDDESDDCDESTSSSRQVYSVKASTSLEAVQHLPGSKCTSTINNYRSDDKTLDSKLQSDSHQYQTSELENAWIPTTCVQRGNIDDHSQTQAIYEKVRDILNKLTLENVDKLAKRVKSLDINSHEKLQGVVDVVFEKAINESNFAYTYAHMCKKLTEMQINDNIKQDNKTKQGNCHKKNFRVILVARCEHEFESASVNTSERDAKLKEIEECNDIKKKKKLTALLNDADCRLCKKLVGYYNFIGELLNRDMLKVTFIHRCIKHLLKTPVGYNIECLCMLLTTTGAKLENSKENNFSWYFGKMHRLAKDKTGPKKLSSRLRFMLHDVIKLKARKWEPIKYKDNTMKQPYAVATSTSMETNQQTSNQLPGCTSGKKNYRSNEKSLGKSTSSAVSLSEQNTQQFTTDSQNDSQQLENSGKPIIRWQISETIGDSQTQSLHGKVQSILNKLTLENVDKLAKQVKSLDINSHEKLQCVVDVVFEKTINEPNFVAVSAIMCKKLADIRINDNIRQNNETKQENCDKKNFRTLLLERCEHELKNAVDKVARDAKLEEIKECDDIKKKTKLIALLIDADCRAVGNIRLIDELFNHTMLTVVFIKTCINHLLTIPDENNIECLCELLKTIGATRESLKNNIFNDYFSQMTELAQSDNDEISSRVRFMLQNVIDLRAQNSKPKRAEGNPITINQVSKEGSPSKEKYNDVLPLVPTPVDKKILTEDEIKNEIVIIFHGCKIFSSTNTFVDTSMEHLKNKLDNSTYPYFIRESLNIIFGRASIYREYFSSLFAHMIINNMFPLSLFQSEFEKLLELPKNLFIDLPVFWTYLAEILKPLVIRRAHPLNELVRTTSVLKNIGLVGKLVGELLRLLAESEGPSTIIEKWNASGIKLTDLVDTSLENPDDIVEQYNLQFLINDATKNIPSSIELAYEQINEQLLKLLRDYDFDNITSWITESIGQEGSKKPKFIRILFTSILETVIEPLENSSYKVNRLKLDYFLPLIARYVNKDQELELQCLYALTAFNYKLENPRGVLSIIVDKLYEFRVVSDKVFLAWLSCPDKAEMLGHGCAVLALTSFLVQLKEGHEEPSEKA